MPSTKLIQARKIARALRPYEDTLDTCIMHKAKLLSTIIEGRLSSGVGLNVGHDAFLSAADGLNALRNARTHAIACHQQLADIRDAYSLDPEEVGCTLTKGGNIPKDGEAHIQPGVDAPPASHPLH